MILQLDSLALISIASYAVLWAVTVAAAPRRDREGRGLWDLVWLLAGTLLAYAAANVHIFAVGWMLTVWRFLPGERLGARIAFGVSTLLVALAAMAVDTPYAFGAFLLAMLLRKGIFPTHFLTIEAFESLRLPALSLYLNSHLGGYLLIRFVIPQYPQLAAEWLPIVSLLALITSVYMAIAALADTQPRRVLGLLWLSQASFVLAGLATRSQEGITGALIHWWVVAFAMTGLISIYGSLEARISTIRSQTRFHGLGAHAPRLAVYFAVCGLALVGLPGTLGFVAEDLLFHGALKAHPLLGVALPLATALNAITVLRLFTTLFLGKRAVHVPPIPDALPAERVAFTVVIVLLVFGGLLPALLIALRTDSAVALARLLAGQ